MKCISIILILSFLYYCLGCYKTKIIKQEDEIRNCLEQKEGIYYLTARISERYSFRDHHYKYNFENDTLYGSAKRVTSDPWQKFEKVKFPISDINGIETQEISPYKWRTCCIPIKSGLPILKLLLRVVSQKFHSEFKAVYPDLVGIHFY